MTTNTMPSSGITRRQAVQCSAAALAGTSLLDSHNTVFQVCAAGGDTLRIGLVGCGGRGTGAAAQALNADKNVKLVALGDVFKEPLESCLAALKRDEDTSPKVSVQPENCYVGFDAYRQVIDSGVDAVLLCTPPHFRPAHLRYAVERGKHVFAEKPVAVDAPGVRSVLASCAEARKKGLTIVSGLQRRYAGSIQELMRRVHDGAIGEILTVEANDLRGRIWVKPRQKDWSDMEWQLRNWYYFTWLSGDFNVEQHVHYLDLCSWVLKGANPVRATALGGRQARTGPEYGHIYDHFAVVYEYAQGPRLFSQCRQQAGCHNDTSAIITGTRGKAEISSRRLAITGANAWQFRGRPENEYQTEHNEFFASIRTGKALNNGEYMAHSTLMAILGRMAAYTGQVITWEMALQSREDLSPSRYDWNLSLPVPSVARPGETKFS